MKSYFKFLDLFLSGSFGFFSVASFALLFLNRFTLPLLLSAIGFALLSVAYSSLIRKTLGVRIALTTITLVIVLY